jgi:hypothetical protein
MRYPLVPDEEPTPLERVLAIADSGNGASWELDMNRWLFINPELTVHLHREAAGEWICLDAQTAIPTGGAGLATSVLSDRDGPSGRRRPVPAHRTPRGAASLASPASHAMRQPATDPSRVRHRRNTPHSPCRLCAIQRASLDACVFTPIIQFWTPAVEWRALFPAGQS